MTSHPSDDVSEDTAFDLASIERERVLAQAAAVRLWAPETVTAASCPRSAGGQHDYFSEGDYWWPDPDRPASVGAPYIQRDGQTNPDNFVTHRRSMLRLADAVGTLTSVYLLTGGVEYVTAAAAHLRAWFVEPATRMNPNLCFAQAIHGRHTGRGIGIIDTLHLIEVARAATVLREAPDLLGEVAEGEEVMAGTIAWFTEYLHWLNHHPYGQAERVFPNNHGAAWSLQAATFAALIGDEAQLEWVRERFVTEYLGVMMDERGGFPKELARTKPYGYSLFMIDLLAGIAQIDELTRRSDSARPRLWDTRTSDGKSMALGMNFIVPFVVDKSTWPFAQDVMHWDEWPVRHPSLLFGGRALHQPNWLAHWQALEPNPANPEVRRNLPIRHPLLWMRPSAV